MTQIQTPAKPSGLGRLFQRLGGRFFGRREQGLEAAPMAGVPTASPIDPLFVEDAPAPEAMAPLTEALAAPAAAVEAISAALAEPQVAAVEAFTAAVIEADLAQDTVEEAAPLASLSAEAVIEASPVEPAAIVNGAFEAEAEATPAAERAETQDAAAAEAPTLGFVIETGEEIAVEAVEKTETFYTEEGPVEVTAVVEAPGQDLGNVTEDEGGIPVLLHISENEHGELEGYAEVLEVTGDDLSAAGEPDAVVAVAVATAYKARTVYGVTVTAEAQSEAWTRWIQRPGTTMDLASLFRAQGLVQKVASQIAARLVNEEERRGRLRKDPATGLWHLTA